MRLPLLGCLAVLTLALPSRADDWLQFRHDEHRSGASRDPIQLPLGEIWSLPATTGVAVWHGLAFYCGTWDRKPALIAVNARTGQVRWHRPLAWQMEQRPAPAVTTEGVVSVFDWQGAGAAGRRTVFTIGDPRNGPVVIKAFAAENGQPLAELATGGPERATARRIVLLEGGGSTVTPWNYTIDASSLFVSPPLINNNDLFTVDNVDKQLRWRIGGEAQVSSLHYLHPMDGDSTAPVRASDNPQPPLVSLGSGVFRTGKITHSPFGQPGEPVVMTLLDPGAGAVWHRPVPGAPGAASVDNNLIFVPFQAGTKELIQALNPATGLPIWSFPIAGAPQLPDQSGFAAFSELVTTQNRVFGFHGLDLVALDQRTGIPMWINRKVWSIPRRLVASQQHLFISGRPAGSTTGGLVALKLQDGTQAGFVPMSVSEPRELALSGGMIYGLGLVDPKSALSAVTALAPAERTFRMAIDSDRRADYRALPVVEGAEPVVAEKAAANSPNKAVADAAILRLQWDGRGDDFPKRCRERRALIDAAPLLVSIDWLNGARSARIPTGGSWTPAEISAFASACGQAAAASRADYLEVGSDLNVYLARFPEERDHVRNLLKAVVAEAHLRSSGTKVLASLNVELLGGVYGGGAWRPFGELKAKGGDPGDLAICDGLDAVGLSCTPEAGFRAPIEIPADYLLAIRDQLKARGTESRPILVSAAVSAPDGKRDAVSAAFLQVALQRSYWLSSPLVSCPSLRPITDKDTRLTPWIQTLGWKHVERLTLSEGIGS